MVIFILSYAPRTRQSDKFVLVQSQLLTTSINIIHASWQPSLLSSGARRSVYTISWNMCKLHQVDWSSLVDHTSQPHNADCVLSAPKVIYINQLNNLFLSRRLCQQFSNDALAFQDAVTACSIRTTWEDSILLNQNLLFSLCMWGQFEKFSNMKKKKSRATLGRNSSNSGVPG